MRRRLLSDVARATGGRLVGPDTEAWSVVTDSRQAGPGALFVALRGERHDGHDFVGRAAAAGAAGALVEREVEAIASSVVVADAARGLRALASAERDSMDAAVIGITGSTGKTCTKDFTAAVLASRLQVVASEASFNNEIGLPLTLLEADERTEAVVCEMGSRGVGHIAQLCRVARPSIGVVTNVGLAHLALFGSRENILRAKGELVEALPPDGTAVLNQDDPAVRGYASRTPARVMTYGLGASADVVGEDVQLDERGRPRFVLRAGTEKETVELSVPGEHMVPNALAAVCAGLAQGVTPAEGAAALKGARVSRWRMETKVTPGGVVLVNDAYNANPTSMHAALTFARRMARPPQACMAVLGHMAELGPSSQEEHARVGALVAWLNLDRLVTVGEEAVPIAHAAIREGLRPAEVAVCASPEEAVEDISRTARRGDVVLVKGSRVAGLERVCAVLMGQDAADAGGERR